HAHAGLGHEAKDLARRNVAAFGDAAGFDAIVSHSAGCGAALRETGHLLEHDEAAADGAMAFASKVRDVSEVLAEVGMPEASAPAADAKTLRVTYHDACHLAHAQKVREAPR